MPSAWQSARVVLPLATLLCGVIGLSLGGLGGGGSVLALPILVYVAGVSPPNAVGTSAMLVGVTSAVAMIMHARRGNVDWRIAALFGGAGIPGAVVGAHFTNIVAPETMLAGFSVLLVLVALWMGLGKVPEPRPARPWPLVGLIGAFVGLLAGFFGVGGGFMIVPALTGLAGLDMRRAIGTSLLVIAMNSGASMIEHANHNSLPFSTAASFVIAAVIGALVGQRLALRVSVAHLRRGFAALILVVAVLVGWRVFSAL
jgi:uncharacterized membrane protein YfcA